MKTIQCTREQFVNAMLTLKAPHPALYPFLSVFAAVWDSSDNAQNAYEFAESASPLYVSSMHKAGYYELDIYDNPAKFTLKINLPHADNGFHETYFETDGVGYYEVRYCGDDLDHLFPQNAPAERTMCLSENYKPAQSDDTGVSLLNRADVLLLPESRKKEYAQTANELIELLAAAKKLLTHTRQIDGIEIACYAKNRINDQQVIEELVQTIQDKNARIAELEKQLKESQK